MDFLKRAEEIKQDIIDIRRKLHTCPEIGMNLDKTIKIVSEELSKLNIEYEYLCGTGIVACIGKGKNTILLRADMDALPIEEESGLPFASTNGNAHACGHDIHTSMLLGAARLLKENEDKLNGTVKLMFQPAEENILGAMSMIKAGVLKNPDVDCALSMHVNAADLPSGTVGYTIGDTYSAQDRFRITVKGVGSHGATPQFSCDPINAMAHIYLALQEINAREVAPLDCAALTIGRFNAGTVDNVIPNTAVMGGTLRTYKEETREQIKKRIVEISEMTAKAFRTEAEVEIYNCVPPVVSDEKLTKELVTYIEDLKDVNVVYHDKVMISEDFAFISQSVPSTFLAVGFGSKEEGYMYNLHSSKILFNEDVIHIGPAIFANCAYNYLKNR